MKRLRGALVGAAILVGIGAAAAGAMQFAALGPAVKIDEVAGNHLDLNTGFAAPLPSTASLEPDALARARVIRAEVDARYRRIPGRKLVVTEATSAGVVSTFTLIADWLEPPRVVSADNGVYYAICPHRATCPYPPRSSAWPAGAFLPRRQALELALRTFLETSATLVVVALPTGTPIWVVFERDDLLTTIDAASVIERLAGRPAVGDPALRDLVGRVTQPLLFRPLPVLPPPDETIYAVRLLRP
jgi:hypothetical protein